MDDDIGGQMADIEADRNYFAEKNMCPDCETIYDENGGCECEEES